MKFRIIKCALMLCSALALNADDIKDAELRIALYGQRVTVKATERTTVEVQTGRLYYKEDDGMYYENENHEVYLVVIVNGRPSIIDRVTGFEPKLELSDLNADGKRQLLLYYHTGARQYVLKMYLVNSGAILAEQLTPVRPQLYSDTGSIMLEKGALVTRNQQTGSNNTPKECVARYKLEGEELKLVEKSEVSIP